jgi:23S rRNA (guanosine2251-2'-O)-methyltransferase
LKDSQNYIEKKSFFNSLITLYGRNVTLEVLEDRTISIHKLHLSSSNKTDGIVDRIVTLAKKRGVEVAYHTKEALSHISKNAKQDQGVAIDIKAPLYKNANELKELDSFRLIALDGIQNPQNLGLIIRSCAAGNIDGIILPKLNSAKISPLVIKASAGTLFRLPIYHCQKLSDILERLDAKTYILSSSAKDSIYTLSSSKKEIFVLGNESDGVSKEVEKLTAHKLYIPMQRGVESLNVAMAATILAFLVP